jgi:hypothetical protein
MAPPSHLDGEDEALFGELSQNAKNGAELYPRSEWPLDRRAHRPPLGKGSLRGSISARRVRVKAAHRVVTLARSPAPVHSVDVSSEDALREVCEALIRHQRLRRNVPTATC